MKSLLKKDPDQRLGAINGIKDIKNHRFFSDINWSNILKKKYKYEKQDLKIDLLNSNFNLDVNDGQNIFDIGINIEEECQENCEEDGPDQNEKFIDYELKKRRNTYHEESFGFGNVDEVMLMYNQTAKVSSRETNSKF